MVLSATEPQLYRPMHFQLLTTTTQYPLAWLKSSSSEEQRKFASFIDPKGDVVHNGNKHIHTDTVLLVQSSKKSLQNIKKVWDFTHCIRVSF